LKDNYGLAIAAAAAAAIVCCSLGGDVAVNSGSTAQVIERDLKAGAAMFNVVDNMLLPPDELSSVSGPSFPFKL
jgi:hypothetical protein